MANHKQALTVTVALDVEEEGLFSGSYQRIRPTIRNVTQLVRLNPLLERGIKPTLFCVWQVFKDAEAREALDNLRDKYPLEIGCHLHYWNTPPMAEGPQPELFPVYDKVATARVNPAIIRAKLKELVAAASDFIGEPPSSFRMGRWDLHRIHWPILMDCGIKCDASVRPLHAGWQADIPDHFNAPRDPYRLVNSYGAIFEVPLTVTTYLPHFDKIKNDLFWVSALKHAFSRWGALPLLAIEYPLPLLKLVTMLHVRKGGSNLSLTWHSSEMMPLGAPHMPDLAHVERFMKKMTAYFEWLEDRFNVSYETMESLRRIKGNLTPVMGDCEGDWSFPSEDIFDMSEHGLRFK